MNRFLGLSLFLLLVPIIGCSDSDSNGPATQAPAASSEMPAANPPASQIVWTDFPLGTACQVEPRPLQVPPQKVGFGRNPFCFAWRDAFTNEAGFRVVLNVSGQEKSFSVPANINELFLTGSDVPLGAFQFRVLALLPSGEQLIDGMAFISN